MWAAAGPADAATVIKGRAQRWRPGVARIELGTAIKWRGIDVYHTIRSRGMNWAFSKGLRVGASRTRRFSEAGVFRFYCSIHGDIVGGKCTGMCGRIVVS